jgi:hypothetical protein
VAIDENGGAARLSFGDLVNGNTAIAPDSSNQTFRQQSYSLLVPRPERRPPADQCQMRDGAQAADVSGGEPPKGLKLDLKTRALVQRLSNAL